MVILKKEVRNSPFHWLEFTYTSSIGLSIVVFFSWMGRSIVARPMREIADFLENPASPPIYDKHITVR